MNFSVPALCRLQRDESTAPLWTESAYARREAKPDTMVRPSAPTKISVGTRGFDLIGFNRPIGDKRGLDDDDGGMADVRAMFEHPPAEGLLTYSSEAGARLFERMMDEFENELFGPEC